MTLAARSADIIARTWALIVFLSIRACERSENASRVPPVVESATCILASEVYCACVLVSIPKVMAPAPIPINSKSGRARHTLRQVVELLLSSGETVFINTRTIQSKR